jgi:MarR family transcriptional regulator, organic hydroperoxide resistance regulator
VPTQTRTHTDFDAAWDRFFDSIRRARARGVREVGELTFSQLHLLTALADRSPRSVGELAELAGVAAPTATRMLDGLARAGVVERRPSSSDRRVVEIFLTDEGRRIVRRKRSRIAAKRRELHDSLAPGERAQAERLLGRLADLMDEL